MREGSRLVLQLLADGRITVDEASDLLEALNGLPRSSAEAGQARAESQPFGAEWAGDWSQFPFGSLTPADLLTLIFRNLGPDAAWRRNVNFN